MIRRPIALPLVLVFVLLTISLLSIPSPAHAQPDPDYGIDSLGVSLRLLGDVFALDVHGDIAWASDGESLGAFDLTADVDDALLGIHADLGGYALRVYNDWLIVADDDDDILRIVDIADPLAPVELGHLDIAMHGWIFTQLDVANDRAYVANLFGPSQYGVHVIDISDPDTPSLIESIQSGPTNYTRFAADGDVLVLYDEHQDHLVPVDMSGDEPVFGTPLPITTGLPAALDADEGVLCVLSSTLSLYALYDISDPSQISELCVDTNAGPWHGTHARVREGHVLIALADYDTNALVVTLDIGDPTAPAIVDMNELVDSLPRAIALDDNSLPLYSDQEIEVRRSTDPAPGWEQSIDVCNAYRSLHTPPMSNWRIGCLVTTFDELLILDLWDPTHVTVMDTLMVPPGSRGIGMDCLNTAGWYVLRTDEGVQVYERDGWQGIELRTSITVPEIAVPVTQAVVYNDHLYLNGGGPYVHHVDLTLDPPQVTATWEVDDDKRIMVPRDGLMIVQHYENDAENSYTTAYALDGANEPELLWQTNGYTSGAHTYSEWPGEEEVYLYLSGQYPYMTEETLETYLISDPANPVLQSSITAPMGDLYGWPIELFSLSREHHTLTRFTHDWSGENPVVMDQRYLGPSNTPWTYYFSWQGFYQYAYSLIAHRAVGVYSLGLSTGVEEGAAAPAALPSRITLAPVYPNPFNGQATVRFSLPAPGEVSVALVNTLGQTVWQLGPTPYTPGSHTLTLPGDGLASGRYLLQVDGGGLGSSVQPVTLVK